MRPTNDDYDVLAAMLVSEMAEMLGAEEATEQFDPGVKVAPAQSRAWVPLHGPTQTEIFNDQSRIVGACAEKGTGKSIAFADKIIAHCYSEWDALAVIIGNSHRALAEGICSDLISFCLPRWKDGNRQPLYNELADGSLVPNPTADDLIDNGIGLEYSAWKSDPNNKDLFLKIRNRFGGWSRIRVIAIPYGDMVQSRVTNLNASMFYLEEATRCDSRNYFKYPSIQLGRRRGIKGRQQFLFSCNPDDPEHWVHVWMYKDSVAASHVSGRDWPKDREKPGIRRKLSVAFYDLPFHENRRNLSEEYREGVMESLEDDPVESARLLGGKWMAKPSGDALFKGHYVEARHIHGELETSRDGEVTKSRGLTPVPGFPIVISVDWGSRNVGGVFKQIIESEEGPFDLTIGSVSYYQEMHKTRELAISILEIMRYWTRWLWREKEFDPETAAKDDHGNLKAPAPSWCWWFITGDDATTNFNPTSGNIHARDLSDHMQTVVDEDPVRYMAITLPIIRGCPRPKDSVSKRVDIMTEALMTDMAAVSAICEDVKGMMAHLPRDKDIPSHPAKGNRWIHIFDAWSYANYYRRFVLPTGFYIIDEGAAIEVA